MAADTDLWEGHCQKWNQTVNEVREGQMDGKAEASTTAVTNGKQN